MLGVLLPGRRRPCILLLHDSAAQLHSKDSELLNLEGDQHMLPSRIIFLVPW